MSQDAPAAGDWIALYGSLMRGLGGLESLGLTNRLRYVGPCVCTGELFDLGEYPGLRPGDAHVIGELYAVLDADTVERLDEFEGFDPANPRESLYLRSRVTLVEPTATAAWIYQYNAVPDASTRIPSGDWRAHLESRKSVRND